MTMRTNARVEIYKDPSVSEWVPCDFLGLITHEDSGEILAIVRVEDSIMLKMVHPSRVKLYTVPCER